MNYTYTAPIQGTCYVCARDDKWLFWRHPADSKVQVATCADREDCARAVELQREEVRVTEYFRLQIAAEARRHNQRTGNDG